MFYFDEDREENEQRGCGEEGDCLEEGEYMASRRLSSRSRGSEGFVVGTWESESEEEQEEAEESIAQLVPMKMGAFTNGGRRKRTQSRSKKCSFYDFYTMKGDSLGAGAYGSVRSCVQKTSGVEMAVKLVDKRKSGHSRARIMREVDTFRLCANHPNIVQLIDWFEDADYYYMVFEKMRGGPLLNHIQQKVFFTEAEASRVTRDIASALKFLHDQGIAHRDVKPENILCTEPDRVSPVKLCDLDLASKAVPSSPPRLSSVASEPDLASPVGSAEFMAPEVVDAFVGDALKYDKRCDMWSLGVIVYIMICGYPPFYGGDCEADNCGWDEGEACDECQARLFARIQAGVFDFPEEEWDQVSDDAKDLICSLLVRDARKRLTAEQVLAHPWISRGAPDTHLQTPSMLFRNDSTRDVHQMSEHFNILTRLPGLSLEEVAESSSSPSPSPPSDDSILSHGLPSHPPFLLSTPLSSRIADSCMTTSYPSASLLACQQSVARHDSHPEMREGQVNV